MQMGQGSHTYEVVENWAKIPASVELGYTHGIVVDSTNHIYIFHTGTPALIKLDAEGNYVSGWGEEFAGGAHGLLLNKEEDQEVLYLTDIQRGLVVKTTLDGNKLLTLEVPPRSDIYDDEKPYKPTDVAVAPNGDIYVADGYGQHWVHRYTADGTYQDSFGGKGEEPGKLICCHGISVDLRGDVPELYVADRGNNRIQVFSLEGLHKRFVTDDMDMPCSFYYDGEEIIFPDLHSRVTIFDKNDRLITHLGEDPEAYKQEGWPNLPKSYYQMDKFSSPHGVCVDPSHNIYVAEWIHDGRITKLRRK